MSGDRNKPMNAVRVRKETQVYNAEEKRALAVFNYEQTIKREQKIMKDMQKLLQSKLEDE